jgi:type IV secretion system T-DNA border endonuclease VirD2
MDEFDEPLLDFGRARMVKGRGIYVRLSRAERIRAARGVRQAIVKVSSYSRGAKGVADNLRYISRNGELELEKDTGEVIKTLEDQKDLIASWAIDFDNRKRSRDTANIIFSMPPGSPVEALRGAARATGARAFPDNEWVFAIHEDRAHRHAHMSVKMRGRENGKKLELRKADLRQLREIFAQASREQGVELAASSRAQRGIGRKSVRQPVYHLKQKKIKLGIETQTIQELNREIIQRDWKEKPWDRAIFERNKHEREEYRKTAAEVRLDAEKETDQAIREQLLKDAQALDRFAETMPKAKTKRQVWKEFLWQKRQEREREKKRAADRSEGMEL